ncbi:MULTISPECIES: nuclear transport factor 2 family protein [unclassified Janthinobacterium]|uniref:nuclear transport factor 2 family protein n=1 Tax=unclassified Janthinobacterium TaxID=2610881 RepID=UPI001608DE5D|nr:MULTISPECIES: nuclear transport factor 2 family protein [unclassified Janthinobacterium]MBB5368325.1 putative SnoaL-like aldol condensation-catalyzing enzyme [Janthinobacterium sp. K2C7]MBB5382139.1 putative SnoaL-like aldol condensation-catalyzing enzyme [Janthinobacterium sp. K2Li3]MBB5386707.1 putative SnoaL-like aldol condensation-catalyzing enzyme [Janthinobacterium sp. K2E3]
MNALKKSPALFTAAVLIASALTLAVPAAARADELSSAIDAGPAAVKQYRDKLEQNKKTVIAFYNKALNDKDAEAALQFVGLTFRQHNPAADDGRDGFRKFIKWVHDDHPNSHAEIRQAFADGDYVILNTYIKRFPDERGLAVGEIFRLENGKIVEHWDRIQALPETSKNTNTMF